MAALAGIVSVDCPACNEPIEVGVEAGAPVRKSADAVDVPLKLGAWSHSCPVAGVTVGNDG